MSQTKKVLITGFKGKSNSSKLLIDKIRIQDKLYLESFAKIDNEIVHTDFNYKILRKILKNNDYE